MAPKLNHGLLFGLIIFISAFLLFQVQPLISKYILPWYGGTPAVWTTALLFFQVFLVGGYGYAHLSTRYLPPRAQAALHVALLAGASLLLPIAPGDTWKPSTALENPTGHIMLLLAGNVGLSYFLLASTSPLMQAWYSRADPGKSPYRFYALSNIGSLLALLSYPFLIEPGLTLPGQITLWSTGFVICGLLSAAGAIWWWRSHRGAAAKHAKRAPNMEPGPRRRGRAEEATPGTSDWLLWLALPATASAILLATTNQVTQQVAVVPFLWVLPLSLYLLTFIVCFENERLYSRVLFVPAFLVAMLALLYILPKDSDHFPPLAAQIAIYAAVMFVCCMVCHGELVRRKPPPRHLTAFYLMIGVGGALGGVFVALLAPLVFKRFFELHVGVMLCFALLLGSLFLDRRSSLHRGRSAWRWGLLGVAFLATGYGLYDEATEALAQQRDSTRNFYGISWVEENRTGDPSRHFDALIHSGITHGSQYVAAERRCRPTTYYVEKSGVGLTIRSFPRRGLRIGAVGLGIGVLATYTAPGDTMRFYEINPAIERVARERFSFMSECATDVEVVLGDARLSLEREAPQEYDILVLDAFRGDALPVHLLTVEAFDTYLRHLKPDGAIAVHLSNHHFNLKPLFWKMAEHLGFESLVLILGYADADAGGAFFDVYGTWMVMTNNAALLSALPRASARRAAPSGHAQVLVDPEKNAAHIVRVTEEERRLLDRVRLWTDDYSNPFQLLR